VEVLVTIISHFFCGIFDLSGSLALPETDLRLSRRLFLMFMFPDHFYVRKTRWCETSFRLLYKFNMSRPHLVDKITKLR
jgi:hypothetical protein